MTTGPAGSEARFSRDARLSRLLFPLRPLPRRGPLLLGAPLAALILFADFDVLTPSDFNLDLPRLGPLALGQRDRQHAVSVVGLDVVRLNRCGKRERPLERTVRSLVSMDPLCLLLCLLLLGPVHRQQVALERNLEVLGPDTGNLRTDADVVGLFKDVDRRYPRGGSAVAVLPIQPAQGLIQQALHAVVQVREPSTWLPGIIAAGQEHILASKEKGLHRGRGQPACQSLRRVLCRFDKRVGLSGRGRVKFAGYIPL